MGDTSDVVRDAEKLLAAIQIFRENPTADNRTRVQNARAAYIDGHALWVVDHLKGDKE